MGDDRSPADYPLPFRGKPVDLARLSFAETGSHIVVHEAGHAVVACAFGVPIIEIRPGDLEPVQVTGGWGIPLAVTHFDAPDGDLRRLTDSTPAQIATVLMGGLCAEEMILGRHVSAAWAKDVEIARKCLGFEAEVSKESMEAQHRQEVFFSCIHDAHEIITAKETAVRNVAKAVTRTGRLSGDEIAKIVSIGDQVRLGGPELSPTRVLRQRCHGQRQVSEPNPRLCRRCW